MNHLIIGASGQVGENLHRVISDKGFRFIGTYYSHSFPDMERIDIRNKAEVHSFIEKNQPNIVYLPASLANVDYCEMHKEESSIINVTGVRNVVKAVNDVGAKLVYFSSDYVFDGKAGPYREDDLANPICEYGKQKLIAEHYLAEHALDYLIIRTTVVYGWESQGKNFIHRLLSTLMDGNTIKVPVDQIGNPTYALNLAQAVVELALSNANGVYHVVGPDRVNRYKFACEAANIFGLDTSLIRPSTTKELGQVAPRPLNAGMIAEKASYKLTMPLMGYRDGLRAMVSEEVK